MGIQDATKLCRFACNRIECEANRNRILWSDKYSLPDLTCSLLHLLIHVSKYIERLKKEYGYNVSRS